jgi:hypothetical protein
MKLALILLLCCTSPLSAFQKSIIHAKQPGFLARLLDCLSSRPQEEQREIIRVFDHPGSTPFVQALLAQEQFDHFHLTKVPTSRYKQVPQAKKDSIWLPSETDTQIPDEETLYLDRYEED